MNRIESAVPQFARIQARKCAHFARILAAFFLLTCGLNAAALLCPTTIENDPAASADGCGVLLNVAGDLKMTATATGTAAYNGSDSTFGIINDSASVIDSIWLAGGDITAFTGNGITTYISANGVPIPPASPIVYGYESYYGPSTTFSQVDSAANRLLVSFTGGLLPGASTWFSLAGDPAVNVAGLSGPDGVMQVNTGSAVPEPSTCALGLAGLLLIGLRGSRHKALVRSVGAVALITCSSVGAVSAAEIVQLPSSPKPEQLADAKVKLRNGAIVAMVNASPAQFSGYFNVALPSTNQNPEIPLRYCVVAVHRQANGATHVYAGQRVLPNTSLTDCMSRFQKWAESEDQLKDPPDTTAWTELSTTTATTPSEVASHGVMTNTVVVYRANSSSATSDYYLVTQQVTSTLPPLNCSVPNCGWGNFGRTQTITTDIPATTSGYSIFDRGPTATVFNGPNSYSVGGGVPGLASGARPAITASWDGTGVRTTDLTQPNTPVASWEDRFDVPAVPDFSNPPGYLVNPWTNYQAVIFQVPAGTPSFNVVVGDTFTVGLFYQGQWGTSINDLLFTIPVVPPSLSINPASLKVYAGQTATIDLSVFMPASSGENLTWRVLNVPLSTTVTPQAGTASRVIQVQIPANAASGTLGTLMIDTVPQYSAPGLRSGPIQIPITVVDPTFVQPGVLIAGGIDWTTKVVTASAEIWNAITQKSTAAGNLQTARSYHTATALPGDKVFIAGGFDTGGGILSTSEVFSPLQRGSSFGPALKAPRVFHTATMLNDGTVLLAGGQDSSGNAIANAEIYDPNSNTTTSISSMSVARFNHSATLLPNGTVLIAGGASTMSSTTGINNAEIYNPQSKTFSATIPLAGTIATQGIASTATLLTNGQVLLAGSSNSAAPLNVNLYTPAAGTFSSAPAAANQTNYPTVASLPGANSQQPEAILIGQNASAQTWHSDATAFNGTMSLLAGRFRPSTVLIRNTNSQSDGKLLLFGGAFASTNNQGIEAIDSSYHSSAAGSLITPRAGSSATLVGMVPSAGGVTLTSTPNPSTGGQNVTFTATVANPGKTPFVTFKDGSTELSTVAVNSVGTATYSTSTLTKGSHSMTAVYSDAGTIINTSPALIQVVNDTRPTPSFSNLVPDGKSFPYGTATVTISGTLAAPGPIYPPMGATISIVLAGSPQNATVADNKGNFSTTFNISSLRPGGKEGRFAYLGDENLGPATNYDEFNIVITPATPAFSGLISPKPVVQGATSVAVGGTIAYGTLIPTGTVTISAPGVTSISPSIDPQKGTFSGTLNPSSLAASVTPYPITYTYNGDSNFTTVSDKSTSLQVVTTPTVSLSTTSGTITTGQSVTFTATVSGTLGTPAGNVYFYDTPNGGTQTLLQKVATTTGTAQYTTSQLAPGQHTITATFDDGYSSGYGSASRSLTQIVQVQTAFGVTSQSAPLGSANVNLQGTISAVPTMGAVLQYTQSYPTPPNGVVNTFDATNVSTDNATYSMWIKTAAKTQQMIFQSAYQHPYIYMQNDQLGVIWDGAGSGWLSADATPISDGTWHHIAVSFDKGKITLFKDGVATGDVFAVNTLAAASSPVNLGGAYSGIPSFAGQMWNAKIWSTPSAAADIQADMFQTYSGTFPKNLVLVSSFDANANTVTNLVNANSATPQNGTVVTDALPLTPGSYPAVNEQISIAVGSGTPQNFSIGAKGSFTAGVATASLTAGSYPVTYKYGGNTVLAGTTNNSTALTLTGVDTTTTLASSANPASFGADVTFTATVSSANGTPTGSVFFYDGDTQLKSVVLSSGQAQYTTNTLAIGSHSITAAYDGGNTNFKPSKSSVLNQVIQAANSSTTLTSSQNPSAVGQNVTFTAKVTGGDTTPTGSVTFKDGTTTLTTVNLDGTGSAIYQTTALTVGTHSITAVYSGDTDYTTSTSPAVSQVVNKATASFSGLVNPPAIGYYTASITLTGTISAGNNQYPAAGEQVSITIGSVPAQNATIGANGSFKIDSFPTRSLNVGSYPIQFSYGGSGTLSSVSDSTTTLTIAKITPVLTPLTPSQTITAGTPSIRLAGKIEQSGAIPTGVISITIGSVTQSYNINSDGTFNTDPNGFPTAAIPASTAPYVITYKYAGDQNFNEQGDPTTRLTVQLATSTTTLTSSVNPSTSGQNVTFTATVTASTGTPDGTVTFKDGSTVLSTVPLTGNTAQYSNNALTVGAHSITAVYSGNDSIQGSTSAVLTQTVNAVTSATTLTSSVNPSTSGQNVVFTATVAASTGTPDGTVTFKDGSTALATVPLTGNTAQYSNNALTVGAHSITAVYGGNDSIQGSTSPVLTQTVNAVTSATTLTSSVNPSTSGQNVVFSATVSSSSGTPTGSVSFKDGDTVLSTVGLTNGSAQFNTTELGVGSHSITAVYSGGGAIAGSTSPVLVQVVNPPATTTTLTSTPNPSLYGQTVTFTATVTVNGNPVPGSVSFTDGNKSMGTVALNNAGIAQLTGTGLTVGTHTITATFSGGSTYGSSSATVTQVVNPPLKPSIITLTSTPNPSQSGQLVTFTATVTGFGGAPTGQINFMEGTVLLGSGSINNGTATFQTGSLSAGVHTITASYPGDSKFSRGTSSPVTQTVNAGLITPTVTLTVDSANVNEGDIITFKAVVSSPNGPVPTGSITLSDSTNGDNRYGNAPLVNGVGTVKNSTMKPGNYTIVATYGGDGGVNYVGAQSNWVQVTINPATSKITRK